MSARCGQCNFPDFYGYHHCLLSSFSILPCILLPSNFQFFMPLTEEEVALLTGEPRPSGRVGRVIPNRGRNLKRFHPLRRYSPAVRI